MKKFLQLFFVLLLFSAAAGAQVLRPFTARYYNSSVRGNIVYVSNSIISTSGVGAGNPGTGEVPPAGTTRNNAGSGINIDVDNINVSLVPYVSSWKYLANNTRPANWQTVAYNDAAWPAGNAELGYGDGDEVTCVPSGGGGTLCLPTGNKYITTYFRQVVVIPNPALYSTITMNVIRDDGVVIYVNGVEVGRDNMPAGAPAHGTLASTAIGGAAESTPVSFSLSPALFAAGNNTIAVEMHQSSASSSDLSFRMELLGTNDQGTFNSSSADLNLPSCSNVLFAGLYWGADQGTSGTDSTWQTAGFNTIKLKIPGAASYTTHTSTQTNRHSLAWTTAGFNHTGYLCFKDITSVINAANANGTYTAADVVGPIGINNACGGWTIVIAYSNPSLQPRNLTVFDGSVIVNLGDPAVDVAINGFLTPPSGPVSCELGAVVYDGDRSGSDSFAFKQNGAASFYNLANTGVPLNGAGDAWNSKISYKGAVVTTRNPAFQNTLGYDAPIFDLPNVGNAQLSNSQTAATVRFSSPSENYFVHVLSTSISQYNPTFAFDKTATDLNGGSFLPGDSLQYTINYSNQGNDSSTNTVIIDNLPSGTSYRPGSIRIGGVSKTDAAGDDQAEYDFANNRIVFRLGVGANAATGGRVGPGVASTVDFKVVSASACQIVSCVGSLRNSARINYGGKLSGAVLYDSSGVTTAGCIVNGPVINPLSGPCFTPKDTILVNRCTSTSVLLPYARYAGYSFYSAKPFIPANIYNQYIPVTATGIYWAYYTNGAGCSDTARIIVIITSCPDIDDDNDGIPDYVEFDNPLALADHNANGIPNWKDPAYPGYVDNNSDGVNDNFDYGADSDNDGIANFYDTDFPGFVDANADGVNDKADKDQDGIPNQYDLDSDNDGIPDTVESYGVDTNGDGLIDNYTDTDNDGFSQNVDANNTGVAGSGNGLGPQDLDGDGIPNYLDLDSDNDGIPDLIEALGTDANNDGKVDIATDANSDGFADAYTLASALLTTGVDVSPVDGRADNWPNKNKDRDLRPNAYDMDSDGDGIVDVIEAGLPDANLNGIVDGVIGSNGWSTSVSSLPALNLRFTDGDPYPDYLDIDSDDDGIPDNIEGQSTTGYKLPVTTDTDGDGLVNTYDNVVGFGGSGIFVYDHDGDTTPDYRDLDTDGDGLADIVEGNDFNLNGMADDNVTPTGLDTDGDGLDNRFDSLNSVTNIKGTSYRMGTGGTFTGDAAPGSRTTVQRTNITQPDRDWRFSGYVLPVDFLSFTGTPKNNNVLLNWTIIANKEVDHFEIERSINNNTFNKVNTVSEPVILNIQQSFSATDNIAGINTVVVYYRLKVIGKAGEIKYSNVIAVRLNKTKHEITISPNPAGNKVSVTFNANKNQEVVIRIINNLGEIMLFKSVKAVSGTNTIALPEIINYGAGIYSLQVLVNEEISTGKLMIVR